jgi:2-amino-4-hydroxy-6-hydroxymethyldihydropteridine diphosphokinase
MLRQATHTDLPALMALVRRVVPLMRAAGNHQWDDDYPNDHVFGRDIDLGELWVVEPSPGILAAVAAITTDQPPEYADIGWDIHEPAIVIHRLAVDPAYRGAGFAATLMQQAETVARGRRIPVLRVDTNTQNPATQRLLPKLGYTLAGEISLEFRPGLRFYCYEKRLSSTPEPGAPWPALNLSKGSTQSTMGLHLAAIALGSNLASQYGDRTANLDEAIRRVRALGQVRAISSFYDTAPVGYTDQPNFLNAALLLETTLEPLALMRALLEIERAMGRDRSTSPAKGPRIIDLDLLLVDDAVLSTHELTLPHPLMAERRFVLEPLAEIASAMVHPISGRTIAELLAQLDSPQR